MKDGFYISAFVAAGKLQNALDIKVRHDQTIALWEKKGDVVELISYWELERFSGKKQHTHTFESKEEILNILSYFLSKEGLKLEDINEIWGSPIIDTVSDYSSVDEYPELSYHSICHLFTSILFDSEIAKKEKILALALDSGPDNLVQLDSYHNKYYVGCYVDCGRIEFFPIHSPGKIWSNSKKMFGMREGSLMALASASSATCGKKFTEKVELYDEDSLENALRYLESLRNHTEENEFTVDYRFSEEENFVSAFIKQVDQESLRIICDDIDVAIKKFSIKPSACYLGLSGGFALNCPTNTRLMNKYGFKALIAPPCTNDCGEALGIGLYAFYKKMGKIPTISIKHPFYGGKCGTITSETISEFKDYIRSIEQFDLDVVVKDISNDVVIWMQDRAEIGPRALGHRSLLANPLNEKSKQRLNEIKKRQWWRPVAPIVLEECISELFVENRPSPFMLEAFKVKEEKRGEIPSVVHLDGTARVQSINVGQNRLLYSVIKEFYEKVGVPAVCNTSLNDAKEPIIQTIEEAMNFALRKKINIIYVDGMRIELKNHSQYKLCNPRKRNTQIFKEICENEIEKINNKYNPYGLSREILTYYFDNPEVYMKYDLTSKSDVKTVCEMAEKYMEKFGISLKRDLL
mgnify:CR=1 FL=1